MLTLTDDLISNYKKLVYSIISKYSNDNNKEDLFQAGMVGIIDASKKYDSNSGVKFSSFAYKYILGEVLKYLREDRNVKVSRDILKDYRRVCLAKEYIYKTYGRTTNNKELSKILNLSESRINEVLSINEKELSLNMIISDDEKISLEDTISDNKKSYFELKDAIKELNTSEKKLIYERYYENKTQTEIARENNMSQVKVYRYERKILDKLKDKMS